MGDENVLGGKMVGATAKTAKARNPRTGGR